MRSINGESGAAIDEDEEGDEDVGIGFAALTFADVFLSTIINNVRETIDTIEKITVGIKSDIVSEWIFSKFESAIRNEIIVTDNAIAPLISIFCNKLLLFLSSCIDKSAPLLSTSFIFG